MNNPNLCPLGTGVSAQTPRERGGIGREEKGREGGRGG